MNPTVRGISPILDGYLAELDAATSHLPADEAYEIRSGIEEHIADSLAGTRHVSDEDARVIVRRLSPVGSIVQPATSASPAVAAGAKKKIGRAGFVAAICGIAGVVFLWVPLVGFALSLFALFIGLYALITGQQRGWAVVGVLTGIVAPAILVTGLLAWSSTEVEEEGDSTTVVQYDAR